MNCRVYSSSSSELWDGGSVSHESEHDLAVMVNDFWENGISGSVDSRYSRYSSDSDSHLSDLAQLAEKISYLKVMKDQYERDLLSVVNSLALSINENDLQTSNSDPCKASCIRFSLVKLLRHSDYDAVVSTSRWQGSRKVPGGDHEYIDIIRYNDTGSTERIIVDIDFRSHFEIARAVESYDKILNSLPIIYVGSFTKLQRFLEEMEKAARSSLEQNSMPLPPWRSLAYLKAKWQSPDHRKHDTGDDNCNVDHRKCAGHLRRLHDLLLSEIEVRPCNRDRREKTEKRRYLTFPVT